VPQKVSAFKFTMTPKEVLRTLRKLLEGENMVMEIK
jgi:hypothetical protein